MKRRISLVCQECSENYEAPLSQARRMFCSRECYKAHIVKFPRNYLRKDPDKRKCLVCGAPFLARPSSWKKYCSPPCTNIAKSRWRKEVSGSDHPSWKNSRWEQNGYVMMSISSLPSEDQGLALSMKDSSHLCTVREHRLVMAKHLGRPLVRGELVHHKNGIKNDNRIENLELTTHKKHSNGIVFGNHRMKCPHCSFAAEASEFLVE